MIKQRTESIEIYKKNNRTDLLEVEQNEYNILAGFLPKQLSENETKKIGYSLEPLLLLDFTVFLGLLESLTNHRKFQNSPIT